MNAAEDNNTVQNRAEHIDVDTSPERVSRLWLRVTHQLNSQQSHAQQLNSQQAYAKELRSPCFDGRGRRVWQWPRAYVLASVMTIAVVGSALWTQLASDPVAATSGMTLVTAGDSLAVDLQDGSHVELSAQTRVIVAEQTPKKLRLRLDHGKIECDVAPDPAREFFVDAAGVVVRVTGTRFSVDVTRDKLEGGGVAQRVQVQVTRGSVEIQRVDGATPSRTLTAGEMLSLETSDEVSVSPTSAEPTQASPRSSRRLAERTRSFETSGSNTMPATKVTSSSQATADEAQEAAEGTPMSLLEQGRLARREGDPSAAAQAYQQLLQRYPSDSRAGLAAFELGRLRMDRLGDLTGAVEALRQAVRLAPGSGFREDAMARLVDAYDRLGQQKSCVAARDSYLKAFPGGVHAKAARARCQ